MGARLEGKPDGLLGAVAGLRAAGAGVTTEPHPARPITYWQRARTLKTILGQAGGCSRPTSAQTGELHLGFYPNPKSDAREPHFRGEKLLKK